MKKHKAAGRFGFTLVELLVVIAIIAVLAAMIFPVFSTVREKERQAACLSNMRQIALACSLYVSDADGLHPQEWWAGATYPYIKNVQVFQCPDDHSQTVTDKGSPAYPVAYGYNWNLLFHTHEARITSPAQTVMLFEASGIHAQLLDPQEGVRSDLVGPQQFSGGGVGVDCSFITTGPTTVDTKLYPNAQYATGLLDNSNPVSVPCDPGQFSDPNGRHNKGSNFMAADEHVKWLHGAQVSAGYDAPAPVSDQSRKGCLLLDNIPPLPAQPCAAGSANGKHVLTFSIR